MGFSYLPLCYHYVRPPKAQDRFPRLMTARIDEFREHVETIQKEFSVLSLEEILWYKNNPQEWKSDTCATLFSFDDGLSDHFTAATVLAEYNIKGLFFLPTCFLQDGLPANPTILHYTLADFGIQKFLEYLNKGLKECEYNFDTSHLVFVSRQHDPWEVIKQIKLFIKYQLPAAVSREVLLYVYHNLLLKKYPNALEIMHLTHEQIEAMLEMGHSIGAHTRSHISVAASQLSEQEFFTEIIEPKSFLEKTFSTPVQTLSYPFGEKQDCLKTGELLSRTNVYTAAFTIEEQLNTSTTSLWEIGRFQTSSGMTGAQVKERMHHIIAKG